MDSYALVPLPQAVDPSSVFVSVAGESPLVRITRSVLGRVAAARVVVACSPSLSHDVRAALDEAGLQEVAVTVARPPGSRRQVIADGLEHLGLQPHSSTAVLVCDHRFPLASAEVTARVLAGLDEGHDVVVPVVAVTDTVKTVDDLGSVLSTVDRATLRSVQYPRGYTATALWDMVSGSWASPMSPFDDSEEFTAALRAGLDVWTVAGDPDAFQVELPRDAELLDAIIGCRRR